MEFTKSGSHSTIVIGLRHCMHDGAHNRSINDGLMNSFGMASDLPFADEIYPLIGAGDLWLSGKDLLFEAMAGSRLASRLDAPTVNRSV